MFQRIAFAFTDGLNGAFEAFVRGAGAMLPGAVAALLVFGLAWLVAWLTASAVRRVLARVSTEGHVDVLVARTVRWSLLAVGAVVALSVAGVQVGALLASLGLAGLTLGLAFKDILQNSVSGVMLLVQRPFAMGDTIAVDGVEGVVRDVTSRATILRTADGRLVHIPNSTVFAATVTNISAEPVRRFEVRVRVPVAADLARARDEGLAAVAKVPGVLDDPAPEAQLASVGAAYATVAVQGWVDTRETALGATQDAVLREVAARLRAKGLAPS